MAFYVQFPSGFEPEMEAELKEIKDVSNIVSSDGVFCFSACETQDVRARASAVSRLANIRLADHICVHLATVKLSLSSFEEASLCLSESLDRISDSQLEDALALHSAVAALALPFGPPQVAENDSKEVYFRVLCERIHSHTCPKHGYSSVQIAGYTGSYFLRRMPAWRVSLSEGSFTYGLAVDIRDTVALVGLRLLTNLSRRRPPVIEASLSTLATALKPTIAYGLTRIAGIRPGL
jgi:hypothetical protein